jgi:hypothetical protein
MCLELQETIEQRASSFGVSVDARVARGRSYRHALRQAIAGERYDRVVVAAGPVNGHGIAADDVRWLLDNAPGEIVVVRPSAVTRVARSRVLRAAEPVRSRVPAQRQQRPLRADGARSLVRTASHGTRATGP